MKTEEEKTEVYRNALYSAHKKIGDIPNLRAANPDELHNAEALLGSVIREIEEALDD